MEHWDTQVYLEHSGMALVGVFQAEAAKDTDSHTSSEGSGRNSEQTLDIDPGQ